MILLIEVLVCTILKLFVESYQEWNSYLGPQSDLNFSSLTTDILSFIILFNYIVPISLYVTAGKTLLPAQFPSVKIIYISIHHEIIYKHLKLFKLIHVFWTVLRCVKKYIFTRRVRKKCNNLYR